MPKTMSEKIIEGSLIAIGLAEAAHLTALFLKLSFSQCALLMAVLFAAAALCAILASLVRKKKASRKEGTKEYRFLKLLQVYPLLFGGIGLLIILQIIWNYWMHEPYLAGDITGETVQTFLASDGIYTINPMTGDTFTAGMPLRLKILSLPTFYAALCKWSGIPVSVLVYSIMPMIVLLLSYLVYSRWAGYLFPNEGKKQAIFMLFVVLIYQFGCYSQGIESFAVFFGGWQGEAVRGGIILPYALYCCLRKQWKSVILCLLAEVCVVWTLYGLGYTVIIVLVMLLIWLIQGLSSQRREK